MRPRESQVSAVPHPAEVRRRGIGLPALRFREGNILIALVILGLLFYWRNPVFLSLENIGIISRWLERYLVRMRALHPEILPPLGWPEAR